MFSRIVVVLGILLFSLPAFATSPTSYNKVELVQGQPVQLSNGATLTMIHVLYAHLKGGGNFSICKLRVTHNNKSVVTTLDKGKSPRRPKYVLSDGVTLQLEGVSAYNKPTKAWIGVTRVGSKITVVKRKKTPPRK